jgi:hypothetical protein
MEGKNKGKETIVLKFCPHRIGKRTIDHPLGRRTTDLRDGARADGVLDPQLKIMSFKSNGGNIQIAVSI